MLGLLPGWYKSAPYRSRAVIDPRGALRESGLELSGDVEVCVWAAERNCGISSCPNGPLAPRDLSEGALAALVTLDNPMVGIAILGSSLPPLPRGSGHRSIKHPDRNVDGSTEYSL